MSSEEIRLQITLSGSSDCERYEANPFLKTVSKCKHCMLPIVNHRGDSVTDDDLKCDKAVQR